MPSLVFNSKVPAASGQCSLVLQIEHRLNLGTPSDAPRCLDWAIFKSIDVLLASDLTITLAGSHNGTEASSEDVSQSFLAKYLVEFLRKNTTQLGLDHVSGVIHDQRDTKPKVIVRLSCSPPLQLQHVPTCATLTGLNLVYNWRTPSQQSRFKTSSPAAPFSHTLSLTYLALLDHALKRFVKQHLVKRYPLIFGFWRRQLGLELTLYPSIYRSICNIVNRSSNSAFKEKCQKLFMVLRDNMLAKATEDATSVSNALTGYGDCLDTAGVYALLSDMDVLCLTMERLFQAGMPLPKFQAPKQCPISDQTGDDQLSQSLPPCPPDHLTSNHSTFCHFPIALYDQRRGHPQIHRKGKNPTRGSPRIGDQGAYDCNPGPPGGDIPTGQSIPSRGSFLASGSLVDEIIDVIYSASGEESSRGTENSGNSSAASHAPDHMMLLADFCEDIPFVENVDYSHLTGDLIGNGDGLIFTSDDEIYENLLLSGTPSTTMDHECETGAEDFNALGYETLDDQDLLGGDSDNGFHIYGVSKRATGTTSSIDLNDAKEGDVTQYISSSILSEAQPPRHAPCTPLAACSRADQRKHHDELACTLCEFAIWDQITNSKTAVDEFIVLDTGDELE